MCRGDVQPHVPNFLKYKPVTLSQSAGCSISGGWLPQSFLEEEICFLLKDETELMSWVALMALSVISQLPSGVAEHGESRKGPSSYKNRRWRLANPWERGFGDSLAVTSGPVSEE